MCLAHMASVPLWTRILPIYPRGIQKGHHCDKSSHYMLFVTRWWAHNLLIKCNRSNFTSYSVHCISPYHCIIPFDSVTSKRLRAISSMRNSTDLDRTMPKDQSVCILSTHYRKWHSFYLSFSDDIWPKTSCILHHENHHIQCQMLLYFHCDSGIKR